MNILAVIPARGGSKGVPGKNKKLLNGKPLIQYSIDAALQSKHISEVLVTTDDTEIIEIAKSLGANVPFVRPEHLAEDIWYQFISSEKDVAGIRELAQLVRDNNFNLMRLIAAFFVFRR